MERLVLGNSTTRRKDRVSKFATMDPVSEQKPPEGLWRRRHLPNKERGIVLDILQSVGRKPIPLDAGKRWGVWTENAGHNCKSRKEALLFESIKLRQP